MSKLQITGLLDVRDVVNILFGQLPPYHLGKLIVACKTFRRRISRAVENKSIQMCSRVEVLHNGAFRLFTAKGKHTVDFRVVRGFMSPVVSIRLDGWRRFLCQGQVVLLNEIGLASGLTSDVFMKGCATLLNAKRVQIRDVNMRVFPADTSIVWLEVDVCIETEANGKCSMILYGFPDGW